MAKDLEDASAALAALPTPDYITLLFKHHKSTTVLSVPPMQPFPQIKSLLLAALRSRNITTMPNSTIPLPTSPEDLELGVLADRKDPSKGWVPMEIKEQEVADAKGGKRKLGGRKSALNESPLGAGLVDGSWVAYRIKPARQEKENETHVEEKDVIEDVDIDEDPGWDVVLPSFEEEEEGE